MLLGHRDQVDLQVHQVRVVLQELVEVQVRLDQVVLQELVVHQEVQVHQVQVGPPIVTGKQIGRAHV